MEKPEGAIKRFSEHVADEIAAGRFIADDHNWNFEKELQSPDAWRYRYDETGEWSPEQYDKKVFRLVAGRLGWPWNRRNFVNLTRGQQNITNLLEPWEVDLLAAAYWKGREIWRTEQAEVQKVKEAKRRRAAWWP